MRGTAAETPEQNKYVFDEQGHLVREENEDDATYNARVADVLYKEGMSPNHPDDVMSQYDEAPPPELTMNEGESREDFETRQRERNEEIGQKSAERRKEALEKERQAEEERQEARKKLRKEQGFEDKEEDKDYDKMAESQRRESQDRVKKYNPRGNDDRHDPRENDRVRQEAHATEKSKRAEEDSHKRGPQPVSDEYEAPEFGSQGVEPVAAGPHTSIPDPGNRPQAPGSQFANRPPQPPTRK
jgi:hypothetical protein